MRLAKAKRALPVRRGRLLFVLEWFIFIEKEVQKCK